MASGVTAWLSRSVTGIQPLLPGYRVFVATPYVSKTSPLVEGSIPTLHGAINISANLAETGLMTTTIDTAVPGLIGFRTSLHDGTCILDEATVVIDGVKGTTLGKSFHVGTLHPATVRAHRFVGKLLAGHHTVTAFYRGCGLHASTKLPQHAPQVSGIPHFPPFPRPSYAATAVVDRATAGSWLGKYGKMGYLLLGFDNGTDVSHLPAFVTNVSVQTHDFPGVFHPVRRTFVGTSTDNRTYLEDPRHAGARALGVVGEAENAGGSQGVLIDVILTAPTAHRLSVYMAAVDDRERHAIRALDYETMNVVAPTTLISDYAGGLWYTLMYTKSVRLRVMGIYGVRISAIAFDASSVPEYV